MGKGETREQRARETGGRGRESKGAKSPGERNRLKRGPSAQEPLSGETTETDAGAEAVRAKRETPTPRTGGPRRPEKEQGATATETTPGIAGRGEVWELGSFWGSQERDPKDLGGPSVYEGHREEKPRGNEG